jgi:hypothetical protein
MFKTFLQEKDEKTAVFTYGRNNPPTIGHEKLFDKTIAVAKQHGATAHIYTSHSHDAKKNPLTAEHKVELIKHAYPEAHVGSSSKEMPSMLHIAKHLHEQGHKHLVMVAGSDRVDEYKKKLEHYNGTHEGALYNFKSIKVVSAGQRDPDAEGAAGMSGTKLRSHALAGEKEKFKSGLLSKLSDEHKEKVYHTVRSSMGIKEIYDPHLKISKYQWGEKKGTDHMKKITPGEKPSNIKEKKIPALFMPFTEIRRLNEEHLQLEFDGIQTRNLDQCPSAYKEFKKMIETVRSGGYLGEPAGHEDAMDREKAAPKTDVPVQQTTQDTLSKVRAGVAMKPPTLRKMQFKQYLGL